MPPPDTAGPIVHSKRAVAGIAGGAYVPAYAYLADISPPERRTQNFGLVGAAFGVGFIVGPAQCRVNL